jgi:NADPH2:quinone reductase
VRAVLCKEFGPPESLELADLPEPAAGAGEVVIDVATASMNFPDLLTIQGLYQFKSEPPFVPGVEGAGTVSAIGDGVTHLTVGQRVMAVGVVGAFAEKWVMNAGACIPIDDSLSFDVAAALTLAYGTSYHALKQRAMLQPGETLLVLGAAGGVGSAAVEIGKAMGATVIAAVGSEEKTSFCRDLGADETVNYAEENLKDRVKELTGGSGADVIYDPVGGALSEQAFRAIAWRGRHLVVGFAAGDIPTIPLNLPVLKGAAIVGVFWGAFTAAEPDVFALNMREVIGMVASGELSPRISSAYPLAEFAAAYDEMASRRAQGKILLHVSDSV